MADDKKNLASPDLFVGMTRSDPVMELLWENGQVLVRGLSSNPSCVTYPPSNLKFQVQNDEGMFSSKTRRLDHFSGQEECSKLQNSTQQDHHDGLFPGFHQNDFNLFFENTRNFDGADSQVVPVCKNASSRNGCKLNPQLTVPVLQNQERESDRLRLGMQSFSVPETLICNNKSRSGLGVSTPEKMKSNVVLEPASRVKDAKSFKNQPDSHKMSAKMKFVAEPPQELPLDEQSQVGRENTNFQYFPEKVLVPVQASSAANKMKEMCRDQTMPTTSMCSRASNDMVCCSPRSRHEDDDLTTSPSDSNSAEEEKTSSYIEAYQRGYCKRKRSTEVHNMSDRKRRAKINKKMQELEELIPNSDKVDKASMLDQAIEYLKTLQLQIQIMQMARSLSTQPMMLPGGMQQIQAPQLGPLFPSLGTGMHMGSFGCNPAMYTASPMLGMSGQMMPMTFSQPPFLPFTIGSSILPHSFPGLATPGEFLASASLLRSKVSTHDSNSGNDGKVFNSKMQTSSRR